MSKTHIVELGTDIVGSDAEKIGVVDSVVIDPTNGDIHSIVVRKGIFFPTDRILSAHIIDHIDENAVTVSISSDEAAELPEYIDNEYVYAPAGFYGQVGYMWPATSVYAETTDLLVDDQIHQRDPNAIILSEGTRVVDCNDDDLGHITELSTDDRGRVVGFKVEQGFFRHHERYIPAHFAATTEDRLVRLSVDKESLEGITVPDDVEDDRARS